MRVIGFVLFFIIFLLLYGLLNHYVLSRIMVEQAEMVSSRLLGRNILIGQ